MKTHKTVIFLIGSPKKKISASESVADYLSKLLNRQGVQTKKLRISDLFESEGGMQEMLFLVDSSDVIVLSAPVYVDSPPYVVTRFMELVADHRERATDLRKQLFYAISNCGYPESKNNDISLTIYKKFASVANFEWMGGIALGMGLAFQYGRIEKICAISRHARKLFEEIVDSMIKDAPIPLKVREQLAIPLVPIWLYTFSITIGIIFISLRNWVRDFVCKAYNKECVNL